MHDTCPTVTIKTPAGPVRINESDFDPKVHELDTTPPPPPPVAPLPPPPPRLSHPLDNLPADWREAAPGKLKALAQMVSEGRNPETKKQAVEMIEAALSARRGEK